MGVFLFIRTVSVPYNYIRRRMFVQRYQAFYQQSWYIFIVFFFIGPRMLFAYPLIHVRRFLSHILFTIINPFNAEREPILDVRF